MSGLKKNSITAQPVFQSRMLFEDLPQLTVDEAKIRRLRYPVWTENKAKLIERYLYYFVLVTKHGTYIDGFAGPQEPDKPETWAAKLVLESQPKWLRHFYLFDIGKNQIEALNKLKRAALEDKSAPSKRDIQVFPGDFNRLGMQLLEKKPIGDKEATFCLLDQRTFECNWATVSAISK